MASLNLNGIEKSYGSLKVVHGIDLEIADGEFIVLVGPSGCGKSTLLRMIAGLEAITEGEVRIGGSVVNWEAPKDRGIAMVFQNYALYPHMTVEDNMAFALQLAHRTPADIRERVDRAAAMLGLEAYLKRYPRELSGGQRQRVAMGRALVRDPKVFLFDEPLSNLDAKLRVQMRTEIRELQQRLKTTTVYVTHDQVEAMTMADRIVVMNAGRIEQVGTPLELYDRPANRFVGGFIGSPAMNMLEGAFEKTETGTSFRSAQGAVFAVPPQVAGGVVPGAGTFGIRPEDLTLAPGSGLRAKVVVIEPTGAETMLRCVSDGEALTVVLRERPGVLPGDEVELAVRPGAGVWFDAAGRNCAVLKN
ncbi:putative sugar transporter subunit: ATP-binding component of ABC superfamily transporter [uncultured Pleomorphomonas sp.]|uniref:Putative sugar transporter subunit: ATP-binding component of ABC superfamily transporter n=1 Tax=uncultured Pleomorphomonas sp. TaxID=442121 RepID=A0A212L1E8_9HYPH|nr:sn-glycerol-3-phosphate ABC transporter ATP-binding protein UgpC [uncultured Pleomorphomonas sp.]SCM71360.1 putative sugar transporter subunit: ATP-binding component of ABC superfamily transporter [uncultured Pleomorphomonas sp.]